MEPEHLIGNAPSGIHFAVTFGDFGTVRRMIQAGVDLNEPESAMGLTPIFGAVISQNIRMIELLIRGGADVNFVGANQRTPLMAAISVNSAEVARVLLDNEADVHKKFFDRRESALHIAAPLGHARVAEVLIEHGLDVNVRNALEETPLHQAVKKRQTEMVKLLLTKGANVNAAALNPAKESDWEFELGINITPLLLATVIGFLDIVDILIQSGANVNFTTSTKYIPLHNAVEDGSIKLVETLLKAGSNVNARTDLGETPLFIAAKYGRADVVKTLLKIEGVDVNPVSEAKETALVMATGGGHLDVVKLLVKKGAKINAPSFDMATPLHVALLEKKESIAEFLIENGANVHAAQEDNNMPLHNACQEGVSLCLVKLLVKNGANVNAKMDVGVTPLHKAALNDNVEIVRYLIECGADPDAEEEQNKTALHYAAIKGSAKVVAYLVTKVADIDAVSDTQSTPLHTAVCQGHREVAEILLESGANVNAQEDVNYTALHIAVHSNRYEIAELLLKYQAALDIKESAKGATPLFMALDKKHEKLAKLLINSGADVNAANKFGVLPIHVAARLASADTVKALLANGAYYNVKYQAKKDPASIVSMEILQALISNGGHYDVEAQAENFSGSPIDFARKAGNTKLDIVLDLIKELFSAVINNSTHQIRCAVQAGAIVNARDTSGKTALHYAVSNSNVEAVNTLIANGADISYASNEGYLPLHIAVVNGCHEVIEILLVRAKKLDFLTRNSIVNAITSEAGNSALHFAAEKNYFSAAKLLVLNGAVYNAQNKADKLPIQLTSSEAIQSLLVSAKNLFDALRKEGTAEDVRLILESHDSTVNAGDADGGSTPLFWSILRGCTDISNLILTHNADYYLVTNKGMTPLHIAVSKGNLEVVKALLTKVGKDDAERANEFVDAVTTSGTAALHLASDVEIVKCLLQAGATFNIRNGKNKIALKLTRHEKVRKLLETTQEMFKDMKKGVSTVVSSLNELQIDEFKAITGTRNDEGKTLFDVAVANAHVKIAGKLLEKLKISG